jgi:hypothetical protein
VGVAVTVKSVTVLFMMAAMIMCRSEAEEVYRMIWAEDTTDRKMPKREIKARFE